MSCSVHCCHNNRIAFAYCIFHGASVSHLHIALHCVASHRIAAIDNCGNQAGRYDPAASTLISIGACLNLRALILSSLIARERSTWDLRWRQRKASCTSCIVHHALGIVQGPPAYRKALSAFCRVLASHPARVRIWMGRDNSAIPEEGYRKMAEAGDTGRVVSRRARRAATRGEEIVPQYPHPRQSFDLIAPPPGGAQCPVLPSASTLELRPVSKSVWR